MRALREGTIAPEQIKIEGIDSEEEKAEKERKRLARREELQREEENLRRKRKEEEKERWWAGAEIYASRENQSENDLELTPQQSDSRDRYSANYSRWDQWVPHDPASLQEEATKKKEEEDRQNKLFEENNKEFCSQYLSDMEERKKQSEKKQQTANALKLKGNRYFKAKKYEEALGQYMEALKVSPYEGTAIVTNIAQAQIQLQSYEDALEFLNRAIYLQPNCVKALSRKAYILGERLILNETNLSIRENFLQQAVDCISKAHDFDPKNTEISTQFHELSQALQDLRNEQRVNQINSNESNQELMNSISSLCSLSQPSSDQQKANENTTKVLLSSLSNSGSNLGDMETIASFAVLDRLKTLLIDSDLTSIQIDDLLLQTVFNALETDKSAQVYFRTNETLSHLLRIVAAHLTQLLQSLSDSTKHSEYILGSLTRLLAAALNEERSSKVILLESYGLLLPTAIQLICRNDISIDLLEGLLSLLTVLAANSYQKSRNAVLKNKELVVNLSGGICHLIASFSDKASVQQTESSILKCVSFLKDLVFSEDGKKNLLTQTGPGVLVAVLGSLLHKYNKQISESKKKKKIISTNFQQGIELCVEVLLGCSQSEVLRPAFLDSVNIDSDENTTNTTERSLSTVQLLLELCQREEWAQANGLAVLMNLTIQEDLSIRRTVFESGALEVCLNAIKRSSDPNGNYGRIRAIGLLSRMSTIPEVQERLKQLESYGLLVSMLVSNSQISHNANEEIEKWVFDERSQLVRTLASLTNLSPQCYSRGSELGLIEALLRCLPMPRMELNEITPTSVILAPGELCQPLLVGNIARCLIPYADHPDYSRPLYSAGNYGIEKLICMMATCSDIRVRKNIAILLAKGCRNAETKKKVEYLRGLQMIVELQHQLA